MSQYQTPSGSKTTKPTHKDRMPSMDFLDEEILDVIPLSVIPGEAPDSNHPMDASTYACPTQGNNSSIPSSSTHATSSKDDMHHTDRVIRNLVTRILNEGHSEKGVFTPLSRMDPSPEVEPHSEKDDDSSRSEKDMVAEGLCPLGQTVSGKKSVASTTANTSQSEKHDSANNVIDLEDDRYDDQDDNLLHHLKPSVAKRMKTRKGRSVAEMMSAKIAKKTTGVGPSKSWRKVDMKKRKVREVSESGEDVPDIAPVKRTIVRKSPVKAVVCYEGLVKEFVVNIPEDIADKNSKEFYKVFVRGKCITFSPTMINKFLGRGTKGACELEATDNEVCREISARQMKEWPSKKHLPVGKLTIKYTMLHKIRSANWPASKGGLIAELKETCKELDTRIRVATTRKEALEALIASLEKLKERILDKLRKQKPKPLSCKLKLL
ncbi:uncharacterized protein LOC127136617 [Lathyrus oleraceus]|uniref:uncharacterized protein LOC127136617 n=1 Tax=Pisum sativum TaxID=3888 RepID=UPI0021CF672E|nr:uncharacterized protein LOC127136617 [Pisum sativum]